MWRSLVAWVVLGVAGCASQSDAQALADLEARATSCGDIDDGCVADADPSGVANCMNHALEIDELATTVWTDPSGRGTIHLFVDNNEAREFDDRRGTSGGVTEAWSCPSPTAFDVSTETVCNDTVAVLTVPGCF